MNLINDKPPPIRASEIGEWLQNPITRVLVHNLCFRLEQQVEECGSGGAFVEPDSNFNVSENYHYYQGAIRELRVLIGSLERDFIRHRLKDFVMYCPDLIINDESEDDGESSEDEE